MTEATINANNYFDSSSIPSKFHLCMYDRMKNIYAQNQSVVLTYGKPFITELF